MSTTLTLVDDRLETAVLNQLVWDPDIDLTRIGVSARDGVVTLTGTLETYAGKLAAERIARRVYGVTAVVNDVHVRRGARAW